MESSRRPGGWLGCAVGFALVPLGCSGVIGIKNVPDGGADGTSGQDARGPDGSRGPDSPAPDGGSGSGSGSSSGPSVIEYHKNPSRDGHYIDPLMTKARAAALKIDPAFAGTIQGPLWGQPLYVEKGVSNKGTYYVADDNDDVYAIDETTGKPVWSRAPLAMAAGQAGSGCGNVNPVGVTGTPVVDLSTRTMYLAAAIGTGSGIQTQQIYALSIDDGRTVKGWPIDVNTITATSGAKVAFNPQPQGQRSALSLVNGYLYVSWGGEDGDCGSYHGWVVAVNLADPSSAKGYATSGPGAGMWAVGGLASDGVDVFGVTGNATGCGSSTWSECQSEAVLRFHDGTAFDTKKTTDFFTPSNWQSLDGSDSDLVGAGPLVIDVAGATPSALVIAMGKSGVMHLLDRSNLGGIGAGDGTNGEGLYSGQLAGGDLRGAAASYTTSTGTYVVVRADGNGTACPGAGGDLIAVKITPTQPPKFETVWCANSGGAGSPIVTTTDAAGSNAIVWIVGAEGSNQLTGWDGETGAPIFDGGGQTMDNVIHWTTLIDAKGRLVVGSNDKLYSFK